MTFSLDHLRMFSSYGIDSSSLEATDTKMQYHLDIDEINGNITSGDVFTDIKFSVVGFKLLLKRRYLLHILCYFIPSMIFVMGSWISFLISPEVIPGRMAMLIILLLVTINLLSTIIRTQPAPRITLLSIWALTCIIFVTGALFAYAVILWKKWRSAGLDGKKIVTREKSVQNETERYSKEDETKQSKELIDQYNWDKYCLIIFPSVFLLFNSIYWPIVFAQNQGVINNF